MILDSSALLAFLLREPGGDVVAELIQDAAISLINYTEVLTRYARAGAPIADAERVIEELRIRLVAPDLRQAQSAARLEAITRPAGLSLGDRFCLALARGEGLPAWTADRVWATIADKVGVEVRLIR